MSEYKQFQLEHEDPQDFKRSPNVLQTDRRMVIGPEKYGIIFDPNEQTKRTIVLSAAGGAPTTTIPCAGPTKVEAGTNDIDYYVLEFDTTTEERAFWGVVMPENYDS